MVCVECGKATEYNLCVECVRDLDEDDRFERFMQEEYKAEGEKVFKCPKCKGIDCIIGEFVFYNGKYGEHEFFPKLRPTNVKHANGDHYWCEYEFQGSTVIGNTHNSIEELGISCNKCDYRFLDDEELNNNIVIIHGGVE